MEQDVLPNDAVVGVDFVCVIHLSSANKQIAGALGKEKHEHKVLDYPPHKVWHNLR